jgi:hypothetical protein
MNAILSLLYFIYFMSGSGLRKVVMVERQKQVGVKGAA